MSDDSEPTMALETLVRALPYLIGAIILIAIIVGIIMKMS